GQAKAGERREIRVGSLIKAYRDDVDELDRALLASTRLKELFLTRAYGAVLELSLDDLQALCDLLGVGAGAIAPEKKLTDVRGHGVLPLELADQILPDDVPREGLRREVV